MPTLVWLSGDGTERFGAIRTEAAERLQGRLDRAAFGKLPSVQRMLAEIENALAPTPDVLNEYLAVLHATFAYWQAGEHVFPVDRVTIEPRLGTAPASPPGVPFTACYLQFPERWFWLQIGPNEPHEPLDGILVSGPISDPLAGDEITVLALAGTRAGRDGASQVSLAATPGEFAAAHLMLRHPPFAPMMDGGERAGFRSIATHAELLHLTHVALSVTPG